MFEISDYTFSTFNGLIFGGIWFVSLNFIFWEAFKKWVDRNI
jgi:hypothetical protein